MVFAIGLFVITYVLMLALQKYRPFIAIAVSSNLQGAATLVGDTTSILLGGYAGMNFLDFFVYQGKPGIFFAVELGVVLSASILLVLFRKESSPVTKAQRTVVEDYVPTWLMLGTVVLLIVASLIPGMPDMINGIICVSLMVIGIIYSCFRKKTWKAMIMPLKEIDFTTLALLFGLFMVVAASPRWAWWMLWRCSLPRSPVETCL